MLRKLHIRNFAIIDDLELTFSPGLNILSGETGAGKSIILDSLGLLMGHKALPSWIRTGTQEAWVEATCDLPNPDPTAEMAATVVLHRTIRASGRSMCRINGAICSRAVMHATMQTLIEIHGQSDHLRLMDTASHLRLLDRFGHLQDTREALAQKVQDWQQVRQQLQQAQTDTQTRMQRLDMLRFQVAEIQDAAIQPGEEDRLQQEQTRLGNAEKLGALASACRVQLEEGSAEIPSILDMLGEAQSNLLQLAQIDPSQAAQADTLQQAVDLIYDTCHAMENYLESLEQDPRQLQQVEERLTLLTTLQKKYGPTLEDVVAFGARAAAELHDLDHHEERTERLQARAADLQDQIVADCLQLSAARQKASRRLEAQIAQHLADLFPHQARFEVMLGTEETPDGLPLPDGSHVQFNRTGIDQVSFLVSTNPGEPPKPLVEVASGGETARLMLAIKSVLATSGGTPTLIFDEIDQGIGGRMGMVVGRKLWHLAHPAAHGAREEPERQILCVTHLAQLAVFGDTHFAVRKEVKQQRTRTLVYPLAVDSRIAELATMQGNPSAQGRKSIQELIREAQRAQQGEA